MGGKSKQTTTGSQTTVLPRDQQTNVDTLMRDSLAYYNTGGPRYYDKDTVADVNPLQTQGRQMQAAYAQGPGQMQVDNTINANNRMLTPDFLTNFSSIPGYGANREAIIRDTTRALTEGILPSIRDSAVLNGQYGGTSQQIGEGLAAGRTADAISGQLAQMDLGLYGQNLAAQQNAIQRSPGLYGFGLAPGQTLEQVGAMDRADQQMDIDADQRRFNFEQLRPLLNLQALKELTGSAGEYGGTVNSVNTTEQKQKVGTGQILGTIATLAALYFSGGTAAAALGGAGAAGGVAAG